MQAFSLEKMAGAASQAVQNVEDRECGRGDDSGREGDHAGDGCPLDGGREFFCENGAVRSGRDGCFWSAVLPV